MVGSKPGFLSKGGYCALTENVDYDTQSSGDIQGYNNTQILKAYDKAFASYPVTILHNFDAITGESLYLTVKLPAGTFLLQGS